MTAPPVNVQTVINAVRDALAVRGVPFGDSKMPTREGTKPWVVGWVDAGTIGSRSLVSGDGWSAVLTAHCYGLTADSARIAAAKLAAALYSLRGAAVDGRALQWPEQLTALPVSRDDAVNPPTFDAVVEWRLRLS